jgi:CHRD domain
MHTLESGTELDGLGFLADLAGRSWSSASHIHQEGRSIIMTKRTLAVVTLTTLATVIACGSSSDATTPPKSNIVNFSANLSPSNEPPGLQGNPTGSGVFTATLDTVTNVFSYTGTFTGLTSNVNNGHIHGPFTPGGTATTGSVILNFNTLAGGTFVGFGTATSGSISGTVTLNASTQISTTVNGDSLKKLLLAGLTYANIHTTLNGGGEIRAQLIKK